MLALIAVMLVALVLAAALTNRFNIPLILVALGVGIFFGSDVTGLIYFDNAALARQVADIALVFILFAGGFGTRQESLKVALGPSLSLATIGVILTTLASCVVLWLLLGWQLEHAFLVSAIISSTDAAATFAILRNRNLKPRISSIVEIESAANDPMAIIATTFAVQVMVSGFSSPWQTLLSFLWQLAGGALIGLGVGKLAELLFRLCRQLDRAYFFILTIGIVLAGYGLASLVGASGMLAAFFSGMVLGNGRFPFKRGVGNLVEALSAIANGGVFVLLGLLVFPRQFAGIWLEGVVVFLVITFLSRPLAVVLSTLGMGLKWKERLLISWIGIRGAVPIVLATYPAAAGLEAGNEIFNIVFFAVVLSVLFQGTTLGKLAGVLNLLGPAVTRPRQVLELSTMQEADQELVEFPLGPELLAGPVRVADLGLPTDCTISMVNRADHIIAPRGSTSLLPGDVLFILMPVRLSPELNGIMREALHRAAGQQEPPAKA